MRNIESDNSDNKININGLDIDEIEKVISQFSLESYRAKIIFQWMYQKKEVNFFNITSLSLNVRALLDRHLEIKKIKVDRKLHDKEDGTIKYIMKLDDGNFVETVYIPFETRTTLCISTQVGCKMGCTFCATGYQKFTRHLLPYEIIDQLLVPNFPRPITNIVVMGMGEPFDNFNALIKALTIFEHPLGPQIAKRHVTVSTVGIVPKIKEFIDLNLGKLAISLHGTTNEQRTRLMPINKRYSLEELMETCRTLSFKNRDRITFEYVLIRNINDSLQDALRLAELLKPISCKINLLSYNPNTFVEYQSPSPVQLASFQKVLLERHFTVTYRRSRGQQVGAACGQLNHAMSLSVQA